jgi:dipeptidyl aminopeptidase/acylaminoacyl peptidase
VSDGSPTVLPDGRIVFARATAVADPAKNGGAPYTPSSIFVMDPDGSKIRQLTHGTGEDGDWRPKASPDGDRILFLRNGAIEVMDADGTHVRDVVPDAKAEVANWSPDATRIVYGDERGTSIVSVDGRSPVVIGGVADPSWSPDGSLIVGTYWPPDAHFVGVATMKPDGSDIHVLWHPEPNKDIFPQTPVWIADQS